MDIVRLEPEEAPRLRDVRLRALQDAPDAFASTHAREVERSVDGWERVISDRATFVAVVDGADVGMVRGAEDRYEPSSAWLISMWVAPTHRGIGVGEALIDAVTDWARTEGYARIKLDVADENAAAIRLYARKGFEPTGEVDHLPPPRTHITEHRRVLAFRPPPSSPSKDGSLR